MAAPEEVIREAFLRSDNFSRKLEDEIGMSGDQLKGHRIPSERTVRAKWEAGKSFARGRK